MFYLILNLPYKTMYDNIFTKSSTYARADEKVPKTNSKSDKFYCNDHCLTNYCKSSVIRAHAISSVNHNCILPSGVSLSHNGLMTSQSKERLHKFCEMYEVVPNVQGKYYLKLQQGGGHESLSGIFSEK
jgi:hypothetical protein